MIELKEGEELYIGLMSGTSMDGVDVALCIIDKVSCRLLASLEYPFEAQLKEEMLLMISGETTLAQIGMINHRLGTLFAKAVQALIHKFKIDPSEVKAIGSHGQTLWHSPESEYAFSMQLGDASIIAVETGIDVVSDFRSKDVALGGEGAPFAPVFHQFLFQQPSEKIGVLNIGGMANLTVLADEIIGFDTGPGNVLMDLWVQKQKAFGFDKDGLWAKEGKVDKPLLKTLMSDPYFQKKAPKSTGRELFNLQWLGKVLRSHRLVSAENVQATLLEFTVETILQEAERYDIEQLMVCGGGVQNKYLMERLAQKQEHITISSSDDHGVDSAQMEAMLFAWLAYKRVHQEAVALKNVTGASRDAILGGIYAAD